MALRTVPIYYIRHIEVLLKQYNIELEALLAELGYTAPQLHTVSATLPANLVATLIQTMLCKTNHKHLGLLLGSRLNMSHHGTFGLALLNAPTLADIVRFVADYLMIRIPFIELTVQQNSTEISVFAHDTEWQEDVHRFMMEAVSMAFFNMQKELNARGNNIQIKRLQFDYADNGHAERYRDIFAVPINFNCVFCGFVLSADNLHEEMVNSDDLGFQQALKLCEMEKRALLLESTLTTRVNQCLLDCNGVLPSIKKIAAKLAISERSLHRALEKEGTTFSKLYDTWLARNAKEMLLVRGYSVQKAAITLGYSESSNFRRAFRRWYACSPSQFLKNK